MSPTTAWPGLPARRRDDAQVIVEAIARYQREPVQFAETVLGIHLDPWQCDVLDTLQRDDVDSVGIRSSHGTGKTATLAAAIIHFTATMPSPKVVTTAPTFNKQVRDILWAEIHKWWRPVAANWPYFFEQFTLLQTRFQHVQMANEWFAVGIASSKAVNMEGYHADYVLIVFDEAKGIPRPTWEAVYGALTTKAKLLVASTPGGPSGEFHKVFTRLRSTWKHLFVVHPTLVRAHANVQRDMLEFPEAVGVDPVTQRPARGRYATSGTYFSDRPPQRWVNLCREEWGEDSPAYIARVLGNFPELVGDNLIPYTWLAQAESREVGIAGRRIVACDAARYGRDRTTFVVLEGGTAFHGETVARTVDETTAPEAQIAPGDDPRRPMGRSTVVAANICQRLRRQYDCDTIVLDETGLGGGIYDILRDRGEPVIGVHFGAAPTDRPKDADARAYRERRHLVDTLFLNLKAELGWILRGGFERGEIALAPLMVVDPDETKRRSGFLEALIGQTSLVKVDYNTKGQMRLVDPDEQDEYAEAAGNVEGKKSPDHFHALLLGWWVSSGAFRGLIPRAGPLVPKGISVLGEPRTQVEQIMAGGMRAGGVGGQAARIERWHYTRR